MNLLNIIFEETFVTLFIWLIIEGFNSIQHSIQPSISVGDMLTLTLLSVFGTIVYNIVQQKLSD